MNLQKLDYLNTHRLQVIQKARTPLYVKIQMIYNEAVDEKVLTYYDDVDTLRENGGILSYNEALLTTEIGNLNRIATKQDFERLMKHSLIDPDSITKMMMNNKAAEIANKVTSVEVERALKNLDYIEQVLGDVEFKINTYKELTKKLPRTVSRLDILEKAQAKGENFKGRKLSHPELKNLAKGIQKYKDNCEQYETALMENSQVQREGFEPLKTKKVWVWSRLEKTRHLNMDGQTVDLDKKFRVENDITGDVDYLRFPGDIDNDMNSCSNICNCGCSYVIE